MKIALVCDFALYAAVSFLFKRTFYLFTYMFRVVLLNVRRRSNEIACIFINTVNTKANLKRARVFCLYHWIIVPNHYKIKLLMISSKKYEELWTMNGSFSDQTSSCFYSTE